MAPLVAFAVALACGAPTNLGRPQPAPEDVGERIVFQDDFSDPASGWSLRDDDDVFIEYLEGELRIFVDNDLNQYIYPTSVLEGDWADIQIEVDVRRVSGSDSASMYLVCRRVDGDNFIFGDIDFEGDARLGLVMDDTQEIIADEEGVTALQSGSNTLRLDCIGQDVALYVNDMLVASARIDGPASGGIGLAAGGAGREKSDFRFDNLALYAP
jgi:hypothetical protein